MTKSVRITQPNPDPGNPDTILATHFPIMGRSRDVQHVSIKVRNQAGGDVPLDTLLTIHPLNWFQDLNSPPVPPVDLPGLTGPVEEPEHFWLVDISLEALNGQATPALCTVEIHDGDAQVATLPLAAVKVNLGFMPPSATAKRRGEESKDHLDVGTLFPTQSKQLCKTFVAYGMSTSRNGTMSATMDSGVTAFTFTQQAGPPNWILSCSWVVPAGDTSMHSLTVSQSDGTTPKTTTGLTVNFNC
jgi:hypothetical protein